MARIVVVGSGVVGLGTAMMLAADGHEVTCLERDPEPPPADFEAAWDSWDRKGVNQFRLLHSFLSRYRHIVAAELPELLVRLESAGALCANVVLDAPEFVTGGPQPGDDRFSMITGRRAMMEWVVAEHAESTAGLTVERGVAVAGLLTGTGPAAGVVHVTGVRTEDGREIAADLVIDASGRRSPLPRWLEAAGAPAVTEEADDSGFVYYGRHFRSADGSLPVAMGGALQSVGSISTLSLAADHGTWGIGIIARADDKALRGVTGPGAFERVIRSIPNVAHWVDGIPLEERVVVMAKIEDRFRDFWPGGQPVVTGLVPVGDAWACTNPSVGRGASIGMLHGSTLRHTLRDVGLDDPAALSTAFGSATASVVEPYYRSTLAFDRGRLEEMESLIDSDQPPEVAEDYAMVKALESAMFKDPDCFRAFVDIAMVLRSPEEVLGDEALAAKVTSLGGGWRDEPWLGPKRAELLDLVGG
jgi:2-polyprenyl-6-methoxyphenol hydroxylase-like FAD-dependent oxidoreductase